MADADDDDAIHDVSLDKRGPQTHVLIIVVPPIAEFRRWLPFSAEASADAVATWVRNSYRNPAAPIGSFRSVSSRDRGSTSTIRRAYREWLNDVGSHPGNVAVLYICGLAVFDKDAASIIVESTSRGGDTTVDLTAIVSTLGTTPQKQVLLFDLGRANASPFPEEALTPASLNDGRLTLTAVADCDVEEEQSSPSPLARAFVEVMSRPGAEVITTNVMGEVIGARARELGAEAPFKIAGGAETSQRLVVYVHGHRNFEFQHPQSSSEPSAPDQDFVSDDAEVETDAFGRGVLAVVFARRLHSIWRTLNVEGVSTSGGSFVAHLDSPWGGGKTTFANFVMRVLNPLGFGARPAAFLRDLFPTSEDLRAAFLPANRAGVTDENHRRPWIVVEYNAWRLEHCTPPWWTFYQAIRKGCFDAIRREGDQPLPLDDSAMTPSSWPERAGRWGFLWLREQWWRLTTWRLLLPLLAFVLSGLLVWGMIQGGVIRAQPTPPPVSTSKQATTSKQAQAPTPASAVSEAKPPALAFNLGNLLGGVLAGVALLAGLQSAVSLLLETAAPGEDVLAERLGLGRGDPLERFRRHFIATLKRIRRPVLVVVDDLDRCRSSVIVDLVRGMQTILRSPRIVFLVLGDREWIERAFEVEYEKMARSGAGLEQSLGARFAEKAIQMSFLLPGVSADQHAAYVREVLRRGQGQPQAGPSAAKALRGAIRQRASSQQSLSPDALRRSAKQNLSEAGDYLREARDIIRGLPAEVGRAWTEAEVSEKAEEAFEQLVREEEALLTAGAPEEDLRAAERLKEVAPWLPINPRQVKRILNAIALYEAAAGGHGFALTGERRAQLARWLILMNEWPVTWRLLAAYPDMADALNDPAPRKWLKRKAAEGARLPGSLEATELALARILGEPRLKGLVLGLDAPIVAELALLTPLYNPPAPLDAPKPEGAAKGAP